LELEPYTKFLDQYPGETAFVVGAGTSLFGIYRHEHLEEIHNHIVVSVNSSFIMMPWADGNSDRRFWISNDALCRRWNWWPQVKKAKSHRIVRDSWKEHYPEIPDFYKFWPRPTSEDVINPGDDGLAYCSSIPSGIDLCLQMGCKRIFLLGVDQYMIGVKSHFWQYFPVKSQPKRIDFTMATHSQQRMAFKYNDMAYPALKGFADHKGAEIFNCSPTSRVEVFPRITFDEALEIASEDQGIREPS